MTTTVGTPDLLRSRGLALSQNETKIQLDRAQRELASGLRLDRVAASGGDVARVTALERSIKAIDSRLPLLGLAKTRSTVTQDALEAVQALTKDVGLNLVSDVRVGDVGTAVLTGRDATQKLELLLATLNTDVAGRPLFAGADVDQKPMGTAQELIDFVLTGLNSDPDMTVALQAVDDFFFPPEAPAVTTFPGPETYEADFYRGSAVDAPPVEIANGDRLAYAVRGDAPEIRELLKNLALAAAAEDSTFFGDDGPARTELYKTAGLGIIEADNDVSTLRARLGSAQEVIEQAETRNVAERSTLNIAFNELTQRDPYDAATKLAELETRLQAIYQITARASELSFINFLR